MSESSADFLRRLGASGRSVDAVRRWILSQGCPVIVPPVFVRPDTSKITAYRDAGDLHMVQRIEVKHRPNMPFTSIDDVILPDGRRVDTIDVDNCDVFDDARPQPCLYFVVNAQLTKAFRISVKTTRNKWVREWAKNPDGGKANLMYRCPLKLVQVVDLPDDRLPDDSGDAVDNGTGNGGTP